MTKVCLARGGEHEETEHPEGCSREGTQGVLAFLRYCGRRDPQLHHIDEDPTNNDPLNLLPICANHHLTDQNNPTRRIEAGILRLFRRWKDPALLSPQFGVLYKRLRPLYEEDTSADQVLEAVRELADFLKHLSHGEYFARQLERFSPQVFYLGSMTFGDEPPHVREARRKREEESQKRQLEAHRQELLSHRDQIEEIVVDAVRFQG